MEVLREPERRREQPHLPPSRMTASSSRDIPRAFLHTNLDEEVVMLLRGQLADLMVMIEPEL
jgi:hypothetical protein